MHARPLHLFIVEPDASIAQALATVALKAVPPHAEAVIAKSTNVDHAKRLLDRVQADDQATVIVVCGLELADGGKGLDVLTYARERHPRTRVIVMTNGERDELVHAIAHSVDGIIPRTQPLVPLRAILTHLTRPAPAPGAPRSADLERAIEAVAAALDAVETANHQLAHAPGDTAAARRALSEAEHLAMQLHRRMLEAEARLPRPE